MATIEIIKSILQQATAQGSRSTVLKSLRWLSAIIIAAILSAFYIKAPLFVGITFLIFFSITVLLYLIAYIYFMRNDPDALRSESFSLRKLEIKKGIIGDNQQGIISPKEREKLKFLLAVSTDKSEEK